MKGKQNSDFFVLNTTMKSIKKLNYFTPHDVTIENIHSILKDFNTKKWKKTVPHASSCLYFITKGEYTAYVENKVYHVKENDVLYLPVNISYYAESDGSKLEFINIFFDMSVNSADTSNYFSSFHIYNMPSLKSLFTNIHNEYNTPSFRQIVASKKLLYDIFDVIISEEMKKSIYHAEYSALSASIKYLESNYHRPDISIDYLANLSNYTPAHFITLFKRIFYVTPQKYLTDLRISKAKELLLYSSYSITEIASMTGYSCPAYFSAAFKTTTGIAPSTFRKNTIY